MYVICIDNSRNSSPLTIGKVYEVVEYPFGMLYTIRDDDGDLLKYSKTRFKTIKENKINKLLYKEIECQ